MANWLDKFQKLVRLYLSAKECGINGEAEAALHMIHKLQKKHGINMDIDNIAQVDDIFIKNIILVRRSIQPWIMRLGSAISELYSVQFFLCRKTENDFLSLEFNGLSTDVLDATFMFNTLKFQIFSAIKEFKCTAKKSKKQIRSFAIGCSDAIYEYCHSHQVVQMQPGVMGINQFKHRISTNRYTSVDRFSYKLGLQMGKQFINQQLSNHKQSTKKG